MNLNLIGRQHGGLQVCSKEMYTWPHLHTTRLQPPFFSTWLRHLGHGFVLVLSQFAVSLSSLHLRSHLVHLQRHTHSSISHMHKHTVCEMVLMQGRVEKLTSMPCQGP